MGKIDKEGFRSWLRENYCKDEKRIGDMISRANRIRKAFEEIDPSFSYENEIAKDNGQSLWTLLSRRGKNIKVKIDLPIATNQMDTICASAKKYIVYLREKNSLNK